jgi:hypothetical protein
MAKADRPAFALVDDDEDRLHATWSRSHSLVVTVGAAHDAHTWRQVRLRPDQVEQLIAFLATTVADPASDV